MIGFRSKSPWKMIVAITYYSLCFLGFNYGAVKGVSFLIVSATLPVFLCSVYNAIRTKKWDLLYSVPVWLAVVGLSAVIANAGETTVTTGTKTATDNIPAVADESGAEAYTEAPQPAETDEAVVFITKSGDKYHKKECRFIKNKTCISVSVSEAQSDGKEPCGVCLK